MLWRVQFQSRQRLHFRKTSTTTVTIASSYLQDVQTGVKWHLRVEHRGVDEELLEEQLQLVALVHVVHEDQALALQCLR
jgi:type II secretory pathway predicted ATPase ExeA